MTVKKLIELLWEQDQDMHVFIQQGEDEDYMAAYTVREDIVLTKNGNQEVVVIEYT